VDADTLEALKKLRVFGEVVCKPGGVCFCLGDCVLLWGTGLCAAHLGKPNLNLLTRSTWMVVHRNV
jgi:hypothetical protein